MIVTSEIDTKVFNPHSSWAAANAAQKDGVPITDILRNAGWTNAHTFQKFYFVKEQSSISPNMSSDATKWAFLVCMYKYCCFFFNSIENELFCLNNNLLFMITNFFNMKTFSKMIFPSIVDLVVIWKNRRIL